MWRLSHRLRSRGRPLRFRRRRGRGLFESPCPSSGQRASAACTQARTLNSPASAPLAPARCAVPFLLDCLCDDPAPRFAPPLRPAGVTPAVVRHIPYTGTRIAVYEQLRSALGDSAGGVAAKMGVGATAGAIGQLVAVPADLVKARHADLALPPACLASHLPASPCRALPAPGAGFGIRRCGSE